MTRIFLIACTVLGLAACETVEGAGEDIQNAGDAVSDASNDVQN